jgi:hypothetical protein
MAHGRTAMLVLMTEVAALGLFCVQIAPCQPKETLSDPVQAIISEFDRVNLVGLGDIHSGVADSDFRLKVIRDPDFSRKVNDIVIEFGNPRYQSALDRFASGEDVPHSELSKVWLLTTQRNNGGWRSPIYEELINTVRQVNSGLPAGRRIRILAGDYPVDENFHGGKTDRDGAAADVIVKEVLDKHRKALVIFGTRHFLRNSPKSIPNRLKGDTRASWFVVAPAGGSSLPAAITSNVATSSNPALLPAKGPVGEVYAGYMWLDYSHAWDQSPDRVTLGQVIDAVLYFGPAPVEHIFR